VKRSYRKEKTALDSAAAVARVCACGWRGYSSPMAVVTHYRYKRPPPKRKPRAVEIAATVVARPLKPPADARGKKRPAPKAQSAGTSRPPLPTVVVAISQKRLKRLRAELRMAEPHEPSPDVDAFFARNVRPGGPLPPHKR
jgi:hypothetical protein